MIIRHADGRVELPSLDKIKMDYSFMLDGKAEINIYNISGIKIYSETFSENSGTFMYENKNLSNGIYFYEVLLNGNSVVHDKFTFLKPN